MFIVQPNKDTIELVVIERDFVGCLMTGVELRTAGLIRDRFGDTQVRSERSNLCFVEVADGQEINSTIPVLREVPNQIFAAIDSLL